MGAPVGAQDAEDPPYPSEAWTEREARNYARTSQAPSSQGDPGFQQRLQAQSTANGASLLQRQADDPDWRSDGNLCATWMQQCAGDPFRYPGEDDFYDDARLEPVAFIDSGGARLSGRVWAPGGAAAGDALPAVVITTGSVQAPETLYWWAAQALVRQGYVVLTYEVRGQGRSDAQTPDGQQGGNSNPDVFVTNTIDAVDFLLSTPSAPYANNAGDPRATTPHNPMWEVIDPDRLGLIGHSLGATGVSIVQGLDPWPTGGGPNPVDVIVAWDNLNADATLAGFSVEPRVPAMGQSSDYGLFPTPFQSPPEPDAKRGAYLAWVDAGAPSYQLVLEGGTHYEWSLIPTFPTTAWEPGGAGGWGRPLGEHFTVAWLDRWLKQPGEPGYADADARLLAEDDVPDHDDLQGGASTASWRERLSFYHLSSRDFPGRDGVRHVCEDIEAGGCETTGGDPPTPAPDPGPTPTPSPAPPALPTTGGGVAALAALAVLALARRRS